MTADDICKRCLDKRFAESTMQPDYMKHVRDDMLARFHNKECIFDYREPNAHNDVPRNELYRGHLRCLFSAEHAVLRES
jgi:hypothetical protein